MLASSTRFAFRRLQSAGVAPCHEKLLRRAGSSAAGTPRILNTDVNDIFFHFSLEEHLMAKGTVTAPLMYLWRPAPVITIGRHQNPWKECVLSKLEEDKVTLARRRSGGGAVFQDLGCSVFTFISPSDTFSIDRNFDIVLAALKRLGVNAERSGRNDLTVDGKKISGSAFRHMHESNMSLHHGTILVDTDFLALSRYLTPDKRKLQAKGIKSVGARVLNLKDTFPNIDHQSWSDSMIGTFKEMTDGASEVQVEDIRPDAAIAQEPGFKKLLADNQDHDWRFGRTPQFSHQLDTRVDGVGVFDVQLQVVEGRIHQAVIFSDALYPDVIDKAMVALTGANYGRGGVKTAMDAARGKVDGEGPLLCHDTLSDWLVANVDD